MASTVLTSVTLTSAGIKSSLAPQIDADRILIRPIDLIAFASDASFYRLIPKAVVLTKNLEEIENLFQFSQRAGIPMTFRAAGSSLSGQSISDGLLVEVARHWRNAKVEDGGKRIRLQPGVIGARANQLLASYGAKIGPDPASIATCTIGGILSNNSSGMCCGVDQNAYHTLHSLTFMLPSGTVIDTAAPDADEKFHALEPDLARGILDLKAHIEGIPQLRERVRSKYRMKNTTGYSLNAFLDYERAVDIFQHVLVGAEGTLAFIAEAVLNTVPDLPVKYTGLLLFPDLYAAADSIVPLRQAGAKALEVMDRASLRSVETQAGIPASIRTLPDGAAGLLAEFQSAEEAERRQLEAIAADTTGGLKLLEPALFTHVAAEQALLWKIRSGMFPSVGSVRKTGTTVIIEDVAFPVERLADGALDLTKLFRKHDYDNAIIFGHAKDGNLHFVITQGFNDQAAVDQYAKFIDDVVDLVVHRYDGALKAEHGTGRNMAPFVETEWGSEGYEIMRQLKELADPHNLLNPGVILNPDRRAHLDNLKRIPTIEPEVDKCIECGYCESKCPSRELTLTPRQRIVVRREMARLQNADTFSDLGAPPLSPSFGDRVGANDLYAALDRDFLYSALDTCATDGLCATACPVSINTGDLVKRFRRIRQTPATQKWAARIAEHFAATESAIRWVLRSGHAAQSIIGVSGVRAISRLMKRVAGDNLPEWMPDTPHVAGAVPKSARAGAQAVYFPSCISRTMGRLPGEPDDRSLMEVVVEVSRRSGVPVFIPDDVAGTCCGTPFSSKGWNRAHEIAINAAIERCWKWSEQGRLPIFIDTTPCTYGFRNARGYLSEDNQQRFDRMTFLDSIEFVHDTLLPKLRINAKAKIVALHPVCSVTKLGLTSKLEAVAKACSDNVLVPLDAGCCAFAGDRGFLLPELTASATRLEANEVKAKHPEACYSSSRTCEVGMTRATGQIYRSYLYLLERATR
ncbi:MAG TPA: FAD-binding and (Fe-S)-binding domain-containing protein [Candidatus Eisenbacteria bacterium]|nr:FAD-binding and (Fe-S)-binding domain-containing protein [Candidatus Eisenbacteria bacterium]